MNNAIFILFGLLSANAMAQDLFIDSFLEKWENSKNYLIAVAEAMPEDNYDYRPTKRQMSFGEQLQHIKGNIDWLGSNYFGTTNLGGKKKEKLLHKKQLISALTESFDKITVKVKGVSNSDLKEKADFFAGAKSKLQILNLMQDHVTHHRGQLIIYLNLNEITPPQYVGW